MLDDMFELMTDQTFLNQLTAACNRAVSTMVRKQVPACHEAEKEVAQEIEAFGALLWPGIKVPGDWPAEGDPPTIVARFWALSYLRVGDFPLNKKMHTKILGGTLPTFVTEPSEAPWLWCIPFVLGP